MSNPFFAWLQGMELAKAAQSGLACPQCGMVCSRLPTELDAVIACPHCAHFGSVAEWLASQRDGARIGRADVIPAQTDIVRQQNPTEKTWEIPPTGRSGGLLPFGWAFTAFAVVLTPVLVGLAWTSGPDSLPPFLLVLFLLPWWAVGLVCLYFGYRARNARYRVRIGDGQFTLTREWLGRTKVETLPLSEVRSIEQSTFYTRNYQPVRGVEVRGAHGKLRFGSSLREEEKAWLVADFQQALRPSAPTASAPDGTAPPASANHGFGREENFSIVVPDSGGIGTTLVVVGTSALLLGAGLSLPLDFFFLVWVTLNGLMLLASLAVLGRILWRRGLQTRIEGTSQQIFVRDYRRGRVEREQEFARREFRDVRASQTGSSNNEPRKGLELLFGNRAVRLNYWMPGPQADEVVRQVRRAALGK